MSCGARRSHGPTDEQRLPELPADEVVQAVGEEDGDGGLARALAHQQLHPAVEKAPAAPVGGGQVVDLAARLRHHGREFAVAERAREREQSGDDPDDDHHLGRADVARHDARLGENARPDDVGDDDGDGGRERQPADEAGRHARRHRGRGHGEHRRIGEGPAQDTTGG